jgi:hypothetical protein
LFLFFGPTPGHLHEKNENLPMPGGCPGGGWSQLELTDA